MRLCAQAAALAFALCCCAPAIAAEPTGFVRVCDGSFADQNGRAWYFSGAACACNMARCGCVSALQTALHHARLPAFAGWNGFTSLLNDAYDHLYKGAPDNVSARLRTAKATGLSAVRIWGHGDGVKTLLQTDAGVYDEKVFKALDFVVFQARSFNIRVSLHVVCVSHCTALLLAQLRECRSTLANSSAAAAGVLYNILAERRWDHIIRSVGRADIPKGGRYPLFSRAMGCEGQVLGRR